MMNQLIIQKNGLLKTLMGQNDSSSSSSSSSLSSDTNTTTISELFTHASEDLKPKESTGSSSSNVSLSSAQNEIKIKIRKNLKKAVAVAASMMIDVNNIFISIGQHILGEDDTLGGAIFFKLDKDGTVLEQLHSAIFKDSNEYDKFVTLAGGDRNKLWEGTKDDLTGQIQLANIPPEVAKLRDAVRRTQKNTAAPTTAAPTASAVIGGNNTTKKYYKRATRTKRPRRIGRRTR
jgi:stress response protein SCP2